MSAPTNTVTALTNIGQAEDVEDVIYRVAPEETPFTSNIGAVKATNIYHEWQTETLAAASATNAQLDGDDVGTLDAANLPTRVGNTAQILRKTGGVSRTQQVVKLYGRDDEMDRQKILKGKEIKRDFEIRGIGNFAAVAESGATTRKLGGALAWLSTNTSFGAGGSAGGFTASPGPAAATPGTARTFTESLVKTVMAAAFSAGGKPTQAYMGPAHKQAWSGFTGIADIRTDVKGATQGTIIGAADVYVSDFGNLTLIPHPYGLTTAVLLADPEHFKVGTVDGAKTQALAKSGDSDKFIMTMEKTLICTNEKASGAIFALS